MFTENKRDILIRIKTGFFGNLLIKCHVSFRNIKKSEKIVTNLQFLFSILRFRFPLPHRFLKSARFRDLK